MAAVALASIALSFVIYTFLVRTMDYLWQPEHDALWPDGPPAWFVLLLPIAAGIGVYLLRRRVANGHGPLAGLELAAVAPREYPGLLGAIVASMLSGIALGPEAALLTTGGFLGGWAAHRFNLPERRLVPWAGVWAIGALFLGPLLSGSFNVSAGYTFAWIDLLIAVAAGGAAAVVLTAVRFFAIRLQLLQPGGQPVLWLLVMGGAAVGAAGLGYRHLTGEAVSFAMTSGEQMITPLIALGTMGAIAAAVAGKAVVYAISLGAGFRGGAYFPAMFIGAGSGAILSLQFGGSVQAGAAAGIVAAVTYLSQVKWAAVLVLGVAVGLLVGGVAMLPVSLVAAAVGRAVPRLDPHTAEQSPSEQAAA